ncbi:ankyrin repeat-containing domain protein [Xylariaceae sp. FL1651]|nr:ankyrin repeat-containing domain protein [Xylariaceae sp. FL1651]
MYTVPLSTCSGAGQANPTATKPSQLSQDCLKSLAFFGMDSRSKNIDSAAQGTCEWLLRHEIYRSWVAGDRGLLWIKGKPGSGKSTLLRYILDNVAVASNMGDNALVLPFFFHGRGAELQKTPLGLFRSLLHQLLSWAPDALQDLVTTFQQRRNTSGKENAVWLVKELKSLLMQPLFSGLRFRICFSCRHYPFLDQDCNFEVCVERENGLDISTYVHAQLSTSPMLTASFIPALITKRAEGVFMWACLVVNKALDLDNEGASLKRIENRINSTPPELDEIYDELVQGMDERPASLKLFQWICFAEQPLSLDELRWAMVVDAKCPHRSLEQCQGAEDYANDCNRMKSRLRTLSRGLAETVPLSNIEFVQFIHQSVKDFLIEKGLLALDSSLKAAATDTATADLVVGIAHYQLSRTCIRYMAMEEIGRSTITNRVVLISAFPLLRYAVMSWIRHAKHSETKGVPQDDLLDYFVWPLETLMQLWVSVYRIIGQYWARDFPAKATQLVHVLSHYGVIGPAFLGRPGGSRSYTLSWAAEEGHEAVVELLLVTGKADVEAKDKYGQTALSWAAEEGHETVVELLLVTGKADVEAKDKYGRTALSWAAEKGHKAVAKLLFVTGKADVEAKDNICGQTAFLWAAREGHEAVVELLLVTGKADVEAKDNICGRTALLWAAREGHEAVVELLLTGKADVEAKDNICGRTALLWAAREGHKAVVELLLVTGKADVEAKDNICGRTALSWAAEEGHEAVVELLLVTGKADVEAKDKYGRTALSWADEEGHEAVAELLFAWTPVGTAFGKFQPHVRRLSLGRHGVSCSPDIR